LAISRRTLLRAAAVCLLLGVSACDDAKRMATTAPTTAGSAGDSGFFGGTDLAWVEINIAMDEELLPLLGLALTNASGADVKAYAAQVRASSEQE
jgi:hypothetical protein